jgi:ABC-type nitrate/sulfonate/bicarbonate transport system permease component
MNSQQHGAVALGEEVMPACDRRVLDRGLVARLMLTMPQLVSLVVAIVGWEVVGWALDFTFLPPFSRVALAWWELFVEGTMVRNLFASLAGLVAGFTLAAIVGLAVGALMGLSQKVEHVLDIYVNALLASPSITYVPIFFIFFGVSRITQLAVIFWYAVFIIIVNTCVAVRSADEELVEMARSFGASDRQLLWKVRFPCALPLIMAGLRLGVGRAVKGMINGEMFIALVGLGAMIRNYAAAFDVEHLLAIILNVLVLAVLAASLVQAVDRRLTKWQATTA